jgi:opacity protein-like surface antigen
MKKVILVAVLLLGCCALAMAEELPKGDVFAGYSYYHCNTQVVSGDCNLNGWIVSFSANANKWIGAVGELNGNYGSVGIADDVKRMSFLIGPRIYFRGFERFTPFAHALVGDTYQKMKSGRQQLIKENDFTLAVGGGIDIKVAKNIAVRPVQMDYVTFDQKVANRLNNFRYSAGIVFRFGEK